MNRCYLCGKELTSADYNGICLKCHMEQQNYSSGNDLMDAMNYQPDEIYINGIKYIKAQAKGEEK